MSQICITNFKYLNCVNECGLTQCCLRGFSLIIKKRIIFNQHTKLQSPKPRLLLVTQFIDLVLPTPTYKLPPRNTNPSGWPGGLATWVSLLILLSAKDKIILLFLTNPHPQALAVGIKSEEPIRVKYERSRDSNTEGQAEEIKAKRQPLLTDTSCHSSY